MSLLKLPDIRADFRLSNASFDIRSDAMERWRPEVKASDMNGDASISIYDVIGEDWWTGEGVTAKRISAALRSIGDKDVQVNINSPGGDFFEGVAIYNILKAHPAKVTVNVIGLAASAASVIAMAGDEINMGDGSFLMIHNAWAVAIGNRHDMREAADRLEPFDDAMAGVYSARSGVTKEDAAAMMDKETWVNAEQALELGFATGHLNAEQITEDAKAAQLKRPMAVIEAAMAKAGHSRSQRRETFKELFNGGTPSAATDAMPCAGEINAELKKLLKTISGEK